MTVPGLLFNAFLLSLTVFAVWLTGSFWCFLLLGAMLIPSEKDSDNQEEE